MAVGGPWIRDGIQATGGPAGRHWDRFQPSRPVGIRQTRGLTTNAASLLAVGGPMQQNGPSWRRSPLSAILGRGEKAIQARG